MMLTLKFDNGTEYMLRIPIELFNVNTNQFIIDTLTRWLEEG